MARHRDGAVAYAAQDAKSAQDNFWAELDHKCLDRGLPPGASTLSRFADVQAQTIRHYRRGISSMQVDTMRQWVKSLKPEIPVVLRFLGYTEKEIRAFAKRTAQ